MPWRNDFRVTGGEASINTVTTQPAIGFDLLDPDVIEDPYPFYRALLAGAPVYRVPETTVYLVSSWALVHEVLKNQRDYSANLTGILVTGENGRPALFDLRQFGGTVDAIANADEPVHAVHRRLVLGQLNTRRVLGLEQEVRDWARQGIDALLARGGGDCVGELANAIPVKVMARLIGLPVEDVEQLLGWAFSGGDILAGTTTLPRMVELGASTGAMRDYLQAHFERVLAGPAAAPARHVMDELAAGVRDGAIDEREAVAIMIVLFGAAGESTSSLVGSAIRILAQDAPLQQRLRKAPDTIESFVEEVVRMESPFKGHYRAVLKETRLGGVTIPADARVFLLWAAANRDPAVFERPDDFDPGRVDIGEHLGFGHGIHFCIGARLARMEARVILEELLSRTRHVGLDNAAQVRHVPSIFVRRLDQLHLALSAA